MTLDFRVHSVFYRIGLYGFALTISRPIYVSSKLLHNTLVCDTFICPNQKITEQIILQDGPFALYYNGRRVDQPSSVPEAAHLDAVLSLVGGKGGFGAMLRALGAQIDKTTNREACRDLSGRRLRDVNEEDRLRK